jgi:hypothetical protein
MKNIDFQKFFKIWFAAGSASFLTLLVIQYFQGDPDALYQILIKGLMTGMGIAILFSLPRKRKDYPWM